MQRILRVGAPDAAFFPYPTPHRLRKWRSPGMPRPRAPSKPRSTTRTGFSMRSAARLWSVRQPVARGSECVRCGDPVSLASFFLHLTPIPRIIPYFLRFFDTPGISAWFLQLLYELDFPTVWKRNGVPTFHIGWCWPDYEMFCCGSAFLNSIQFCKKYCSSWFCHPPDSSSSQPVPAHRWTRTCGNCRRTSTSRRSGWPESGLATVTAMPFLVFGYTDPRANDSDGFEVYAPYSFEGVINSPISTALNPARDMAMVWTNHDLC